MKEKILALLSASNGQYNLPKDVLERIALSAPVLESDEAISEWVESVKPMMGLMQSFADSRVSDALKKQPKVENKVQEGDLEERLGRLEESLNKTLSEKLAGYDAQAAKIAELQKQLDETKGREDRASFDELVKRVAKEVGLDDRKLNLVSGKVTSDMDETKVKEVLSQCKKDFIDMGLSDVEGDLTTKEEVLRKDAASWVEQQLQEVQK